MARNNNGCIQDEAGNEFMDEEQIMEVFASFYEELFKSGCIGDSTAVTEKVQVSLTEAQIRLLAAPYTGEEVREALFRMHPTKAPGPDGMSAVFFQKFWHVVGKDVIDETLEILNNNGVVGSINQMHIVLIPKKKTCLYPADYRPISLCNVLYKIVSKVLANRLKLILPSIIHESQSDFVPGRIITDDVLVAYECY